MQSKSSLIYNYINWFGIALTLIICTPSRTLSQNSENLEVYEIKWSIYYISEFNDYQKLKVAILNSLFTESQDLFEDPNALYSQTAHSFNELENSLKKSGLDVDKFLNYNRFQSSFKPFDRALSRVILNNWFLRSKQLYPNATDKFDEFTPNEALAIQRFNLDQSGQEAFYIARKNSGYAHIFHHSFPEMIQPISDEEINNLDEIILDDLMLKYLKLIDVNGNLSLSQESLVKMIREDHKKLAQSFDLAINESLRFDSERETWNDFKKRMNGIREKEKKEIDKIKKFSATATKLLDKYDSDQAKFFKTIFEEGINIYTAYSKWKLSYATAAQNSAKLFASVEMAYSGIAAGLVIYNLMSNGVEDEELSVNALAQLSQQIEDFRIEMHDRFDIIDAKIDLVIKSLGDQFEFLATEIARNNYELVNIRRELYRVNNDLKRIEYDVLNGFQNAQKIDLKKTLVYYLDYKNNFTTAIDTTDLIKGYQFISLWGSFLAKDPTFIGSEGNFSYTKDGLSTDLKKFYYEDHNNFNYYLSYAKKNYLVDTGLEFKLANNDIWYLCADAFLQLALEYPLIFKNEVKTKLTFDLINTGEDIIDAQRSLLFENTNRINRAYFDQLISEHRDEIETLSRSFYNSIKRSTEYLGYTDPNFSIWKIMDLQDLSFDFNTNSKYDTVGLNLSLIEKDLGDDNTVPEITFKLGGPEVYWFRILERNNFFLSKMSNVDSGVEFDIGRRFKLQYADSALLKYQELLNIYSYQFYHKYSEYVITNRRTRAIRTSTGSLNFGIKTNPVTSFVSLIFDYNGDEYMGYYSHLGVFYYQTIDGQGGSKVYSTGEQKWRDFFVGPFFDSREGLFKSIWKNEAYGSKKFVSNSEIFIDRREALRVHLKSDIGFALIKVQNKILKEFLLNLPEYMKYTEQIDGGYNYLLATAINTIPFFVEQSDSLRSFFYGTNQLLNGFKLKIIINELIEINEKIIVISNQLDSKEITVREAHDSILKLYEESKYVKNSFQLELEANHDEDVIICFWEFCVFDGELNNLTNYHRKLESIFDEIEGNGLQVQNPKIEFMLSKLHHLTNLN